MNSAKPPNFCSGDVMLSICLEGSKKYKNVLFYEFIVLKIHLNVQINTSGK